MKIALDVSKFGQGIIEDRGKTGIFRYTTELLEQMLIRSDVDLFLSFLKFPHAIDESISQLKAMELFPNFLFKNSNFENWIYHKLKKFGSKRTSFWASMICSMALQSIKKKSLHKSFDIFHSTYFPLPDFIAPDQTKRFITIHDIIFLLYPSLCNKNQTIRTKNILKSIDKNKDWIIAVSNSTKNDICEYYGIREQRVFVTHLAANPKLYHPLENKQAIHDILALFQLPFDNYFLSLSTIEPRKNLTHSIECFRKLILVKGDIYKYVIIGNRGWHTGQLYKKIASDPILKHNVIFTGFVPDKFLSAIYSGALAFLYPSLYEGFGLPVLEAMQCGTPVITSNTSSLPELVGDAGIMVNPKDEDALCQAMLDIATDKGYRENLSKKGIERSELFSWEKCVDETINAYKTALNNDTINIKELL